MRPSPGNNFPSKSAYLPHLLIISSPTRCLSVVPVGFIKAPSTLCPRVEVLAALFKIPWVAKILHEPLIPRDHLGLLYLPQTSKARVPRKEGHVKFPAKHLDSTLCPAPSSLHPSRGSLDGGAVGHTVLTLVSLHTSKTAFLSHP